IVRANLNTHRNIKLSHSIPDNFKRCFFIYLTTGLHVRRQGENIQLKSIGSGFLKILSKIVPFARTYAVDTCDNGYVNTLFGFKYQLQVIIQNLINIQLLIKLKHLWMIDIQCI